MEIKRNGTRPSARGPAEHFTGNVRVDALFQASAPGRAAAPSTRSDRATS